MAKFGHRFWKSDRGRFGSVKKDTTAANSRHRNVAELRKQAKIDLQRVKDRESQMIQEASTLKQEKRIREQENAKRKAEAETKNQIYTVIKNPAKIKRMKRKQLRMVKKVDTVKT